MVFKGHGIVWNPKTNCGYRFSEGQYETTDPGKIDFLIACGFERDGEIPKEAPKCESTPKATTKKTKKGQA